MMLRDRKNKATTIINKIHAKGFTFVEMMTVLFIVSILGVGVGLSANYWVNNSKTANAQAQLREGLSRAKALALRNPNASLATGTTPAATLSLSQGILTLCAGASGCTTPYWKATLPSNVTITFGGVTFACRALDSQAMPLSYSNCSVVQNYTITAGTTTATGVF
jgi:type IV pilus assembly protein PilA